MLSWHSGKDELDLLQHFINRGPNQSTPSPGCTFQIHWEQTEVAPAQTDGTWPALMNIFIHILFWSNQFWSGPYNKRVSSEITSICLTELNLSKKFACLVIYSVFLFQWFGDGQDANHELENENEK